MLDIDKQYVMGYSVSDNGYIITEPKENSPYYMKEMALKNRIVSKIHQVILNPKNQINLTQPVTVDQVKALAEKSSMGLAARYMNGWDPSSKYRMQIENMVGKNVIGNVATAIKSFFALSNLYNTKFREIYNLILSGQYNEARNMLSKYTFTRNGQLATLANVNLEMFAEFENMVFPDDQKDLQQTLLALKYNEDLIEDQSMILGALLNSSTDNAKELILKKINADTNWVDIYCLGCMLGESFDAIGEFMLDPDIVNVLAKWDTSIFGNVHNFNKISFIDKQIKYATEQNNENLIAKYNKLKSFILGTEEIRILGRMLKINQGLPTNINDFLSYVMSIEEYVQKKLGNTFSLIEFINNLEYRNNKIIEYDSVKEHFNILEVISEVPHFAAMFNTIATNRTILDRLSKRNELIGKIYDNLDVKKLSTDKKQQLNNDISKFLINTWIVDKQISVRIPAGVLNYVAEDNFVVEDFTDIEKLRDYIEQFAIPKLKQELNDNKFIQQLTFGLKNGRAFYKLPLNMIQIDNTQKTRTAYEEILTEFNKLKEVRINDIDMNLVDLFYLYNLIVNDDKFGPNSLTRLFEDFLVTDSEHTLLLWDFNDWIDNQDVTILYDKFVKQHGDVYKFVDTVTEATTETIGFNSTVVEEEDLKFENISNTTTTSNTVYATNIPIKSKLISFIQQSKYIINGLHIVTDADLINETPDIRNAKGFVRNGEIYINVDRASDDTVIHEFAHIYLAYAKNTNPNEYYALLEKLHTTDYYQLIKSRKEYSNKKGSDLDEEVLATIIGDYYNSNNMNEDAMNIAKEAIALLPSDFYDLINNDVLPTLDDTFIDNYKLSQKIATKKNEVFVKEDC